MTAVRHRNPVPVGVAVAVAVALTACADDGNDQDVQARRAAEAAAELRASQTTTTSPASMTDGAPRDASPATNTADAGVVPTGVVVPVAALDNSFRPEVVEIGIGDEVLWENRGANEHNVLRVEGEGWGVEVEGFQPGDVYAHVFTQPGEYRYYCSIHGNEDVGMVGTVVVTG